MAGGFAGKVVLVTGGSRGIGAATARALAQDGADVERIGGNGVALHVDHADAASARSTVAAVFDRFGRIDVLVNNAASFVASPVDDDAPDTAGVEEMYRIYLHGVVALIRAAAKGMTQGGRIVSVSSNVATRAGYRNLADYAATKAAIIGFNKGAARDLGPRGITVNVLQSGPVATEMNPDDTDFAAILKQDSALGRFGRPEEIAAGIVFLASPSASYFTGAVLEIDGGMNA